MDYSTETLLAGAKLRTMAPANQFRFDDSDYLNLMSDDLNSILVPLIMSARENYYLTSRDYLIETSTVNGFGNDPFGLTPFGSSTPISTSDLLERAVGMITKDIWLIDSNGVVLAQVPQLSFKDITSTVGCAGYYFENSRIVFHPVETFNNKNIRVFTFRQPNKLIASSSCAKISFVNTGTSEIQVDVVPTGWVIGTKLDILRGKQGFDSILDSVSISGITGNRLQLDSISPLITSNDLAVPEGYACVAQIPTNAYPLLEQRGAIKILEAMKDSEGVRNAMMQYQVLESAFKGVIANRSQSNLKNITGYGIWR